MLNSKGIAVLLLIASAFPCAPKAAGNEAAEPLRIAQPSVSIDPVNRYPCIEYGIPGDAPENLRIACAFRVGHGEWQAASVLPQMSPTGWRMASQAQQKAWKEGTVSERNAAGTVRRVIWNPYVQIPANENLSVEFRLQFADADGSPLGESLLPVELHNSDVRTLDPAPEVRKSEALRAEGYRASDPPMPGSGKRSLVTRPPDQHEQSPSPLKTGIEVKGSYAVFLDGATAAWGRIGQNPFDRLTARYSSHCELFWGLYRTGLQTLEFLPVPVGTGNSAMKLGPLRLVPVPDAAPEAPGVSPKILAGYFEPYSWAFWRTVDHPEAYADVARTYRRFGFDLMDIQYGRFGSRLFFKSEAAPADRFLASETVGDQSGSAGKRPRSLKVRHMVERTDSLGDMLHAASVEKMNAQVNFGATLCYPGLALQSEFSKEHPELVADHGQFLILAEPKVRDYMLALYREVLERGAPGVSIDFCRYPYGINDAETVTNFLRRLRALADGFKGKRRTILVRFPAQGENRAAFFDYRAWTRENLVDFLCPGNITTTVLHFDVRPYVAAAKGSAARVLPVLDVIPAGGFQAPGPLFERAADVYRQGADGIYLYQPDACLFYAPSLRQYFPLLKDPQAIGAFIAKTREEARFATKEIFLQPPALPFTGGYRASNDRLRFWLEGEIGPEVEIWLGEKKIAALSGYPYTVGDEATAAPALLPLGTHTLNVRARDGKGWFRKDFTVTFVAGLSRK